MWSNRFMNYYYKVWGKKDTPRWIVVALSRNFMGEKRWFGY